MDIIILVTFILILVVAAKVSEKVIKRQDKQIELLEEIKSMMQEKNVK
ncbi:hypothetical protein [Salipaludibacillus aurantiacus]|uniref:Uncharacterized protein n=1 Tax=Salipaludibacillus aurantiacus TaxID=1601833 RepID=A0A1H9UTG3_9BACI|nr:hypothetical protein [Salipaludibacillus aurantiacus]SES12424.1 hypothetical protein SAMN05518684_108146 [Salipaludibacillus aurantiacus]